LRTVVLTAPFRSSAERRVPVTVTFSMRTPVATGLPSPAGLVLMPNDAPEAAWAAAV
jgi:hypothetical protein